MPVITEDNLKFDFAVPISAVKYDDTRWKNEHFGHYPAMDILARDHQQQWWIEIKDCAGAESNNRPRLSPAEPGAVGRTRNWVDAEGLKTEVRVSRRKPFIIDELVQKLRSTLVGCTLAKVQAETEVSPFHLAENDAPLIVVLYLTWEGTDFGRLARGLSTKLEKALAPYGWQGFIVNDSTQLRQVGINCTVTRT
jgi:hypothetical protein